jgi:hypothetical protein
MSEMSLALAVALLALLVALFALVALVAVYARVRALEAGRATGLSGYASLVGRPAPAAVRPRPGEQVTVVAVLDADCALCRAVLQAMGEAHRSDAVIGGVRYVGLVDRAADVPAPGGGAELVVDVQARADLFEGYAPTVLTVDASGTVTARRFVYPDTDLPALLRDLTFEGREVSRA